MTRFEAFSREEVQALWEGLIFDDGIRYDPPEGTVAFDLVQELEAEARIADRPADRGRIVAASDPDSPSR